MLMDHTGLELLRIRGYTKSALLWLSRLDSFAPSSLLGISLEILGDFPGVHHEYSKTQWKTVDVALYDPKFRNLISFELQDHWHQPESHAELHPVFQRILPRSYERGILWHVRNNGGRC